MTDKATAPRSGLFHQGSGNKSTVPLTGVTVEAEIRGFHARVVVSHRFVNREPQPIEAVYVFPLDEGAAVCGFEAVIDGTLVIGEVLEREQAFERYDDAIGDGHGAFLLDEERPDGSRQAHLCRRTYRGRGTDPVRRPDNCVAAIRACD